MLPRLSVSPRTYRQITLAAAFLVGAIIVTGGAVRLTGSGLGCPDWPTCRPGQLTPHSAADYHAMVEFVNRLFTGAVSVAVIVAVLGSLVRVPRRRDLVWLSWGLVVGVLAQIVLGGITVRVHLHPVAVMSHFLLSMLILADAVVLHRRAGLPDAGITRALVDRRLVLLGRALVGAVALVIVTGTVVTGTGPHAGDRKVRRFDLLLTDVARVHATSMIVFLGLTLLTILAAHRLGALALVQRRATLLLGVTVAQAALGYTQYFTGVPALLVGVHIAGAATVWVATLTFHLGLYERTAGPTGSIDRAPDAALVRS